MTESKFIWRFTPSRTPPRLLEAIFVQRESLLKDVLARVRESATTGNKHYVLLFGPRGIGKTHFLALLRHRVCAFGNGAKSCGPCWWVVGIGGLGSGAGLLGRPWKRSGRGGRGCALADDWEGSSMAAVAGPQ